MRNDLDLLRRDVFFISEIINLEGLSSQKAQPLFAFFLWQPMGYCSFLCGHDSHSYVAILKK